MQTPPAGFRLPRGCTFAPDDWPVLARAWHPVASARELTADAPLAVRLLDQAVVLYRSAGALTAAADTCAHRGAPLSLGTVCGGVIICPYHGYRYDGAGRCTLIPAHPSAPIPSRLALRRFAAAERHGLLWVSLDPAADPAAIPVFAEALDPRFQVIPIPPLDWAASAGRQVESFCDVAHFAFVHPVTFGAPDPVVPAYTVQSTPQGLRAEFTSAVGNVSEPAAGTRTWRRRYTLTLPFTVHLEITFPHGGKLVVFNAASPVSARRTRIFPVVARDFDQERPVEETIAFQHRIYAEDQRIVERQNPEELPLDLEEEVHVRADRTSVEYRRQLARLGLGRAFTS
jgi:phenylpropionate dioxygenase-like ring-hydroxylating dioxygenase large terminal subunit